MKVLWTAFTPILLAGLLFAGGKGNEKETNAVGTLRSINTAQAAYQKQYGFWACDLGQLLPGPAGSQANPDHAGLLDNSVENAKERGYSFMVMCPKDRKDGYETVAWPKEKKLRAFCSDTTAAIYDSSDPAQCLVKKHPAGNDD